MTFDEWWEKNTRPFLHNEGIAKMTARAGWDAAIANNTPAAPVAQGELGTLCFHIEQAIENGCCPPDIEDAYEAYAKATAA